MKTSTTTAALCLLVFLVQHNHAATIPEVEPAVTETAITDAENTKSVSQEVVEPEQQDETEPLVKSTMMETDALETTESASEADSEENIELATVASRVDENINTETPKVTDETTKKTVQKNIFDTLESINSYSELDLHKFNFTINATVGNTTHGIGMSVGEFLDEFDIDKDTIENFVDDAIDTFYGAYEDAVGEFGTILSGVRKTMRDYSLLSETDGVDDITIEIPGVLKFKTNRKDGTYLGMEKGEKTNLKIPGIMEVKLEDTADPMNTDDSLYAHSDDYLFVSAVDGGARIQSPIFDLKFGTVANKIVLN